MGREKKVRSHSQLLRRGVTGAPLTLCRMKNESASLPPSASPRPFPFLSSLDTHALSPPLPRSVLPSHPALAFSLWLLLPPLPCPRLPSPSLPSPPLPPLPVHPLSSVSVSLLHHVSLTPSPITRPYRIQLTLQYNVSESAAFQLLPIVLFPKVGTPHMASSGRVLPMGRSGPKPESGLPRPVITANYFLSLPRPAFNMQQGVWRGGGATQGR